MEVYPRPLTVVNTAGRRRNSAVPSNGQAAPEGRDNRGPQDTISTAATQEPLFEIDAGVVHGCLSSASMVLSRIGQRDGGFGKRVDHRLPFAHVRLCLPLCTMVGNSIENVGLNSGIYPSQEGLAFSHSANPYPFGLTS